VPSPAWKVETGGGDWYLGDTYHSAIGQYSWQVTPVQVVRAVAAMANEGTLLTPTIIKGDGPLVERTIDLPKADFDIVHQGMRLGVQIGVATALNVPYVDIAAKSGTAELGVSKANVNSWITGFWPYEDPHYAFAVTMEHGSVTTWLARRGHATAAGLDGCEHPGVFQVRVQGVAYRVQVCYNTRIT